MNEYELIYLAQEQNEDAREYLYNQYQPIIDIILAKNKYKIKKLNIDPKEIYNIALLALDDAINYYNADLKASFSTYATVIVRNRVNNYLREYRSNKNNYLNNTLSLEDEYIATLPIGYADGLIRANQGREVYIEGHYYPIVGRVCMDQMMVKVDQNVHLHDRVEIFGEHITLARMAKELSTIPYEIVCLVSERVERIYKK